MDLFKQARAGGYKEGKGYTGVLAQKQHPPPLPPRYAVRRRKKRASLAVSLLLVGSSAAPPRFASTAPAAPAAPVSPAVSAAAASPGPTTWSPTKGNSTKKRGRRGGGGLMDKRSTVEREAHKSTRRNLRAGLSDSFQFSAHRVPPGPSFSFRVTLARSSDSTPWHVQRAGDSRSASPETNAFVPRCPWERDKGDRK